jgi:thiol-disulfide isomerase/thioredoxin
MKFALSVFLLSLFITITGVANNVDPEDAIVTLQQAIEDPEIDFDHAYQDAKESGVAETVLIESRLIKYMGEGRLGALVEMIPELERNISSWEFAPGKLFATESQLMGMIHTLKAINAQYQMDADAFEHHAKEAFWNSPDMASVFSLPTIVQNHQNKLHQEQMLERITVPMTTEIINLDGERETLESLIGDNQAMLIDFWASWCGPCINLMPQLKRKARLLEPMGVKVVGLNTDQTDAIQKAMQMRDQFEMTMAWYVEPVSGPLSKMLFVDSIPRMVLLSPEGKVLFSGHPMDTELQTALDNIALPKE